MIATEPSEALKPFARGPVLGVAGGAVAVLVAVAARYGWHRDELYFLALSHHLAWGYVDQPPFTVLVARVADLVAHDNLVVLRLVPALSVGASVVFGALLARELGGTRRAQWWAALAVAGSGFVLGSGHLLVTATFDLTAWMALIWLAARILRTDEPRWWGVIGVVAGLAGWNKNLVVLLGATLLVGLVVERRWRLLRSPWLVVGGALAVAIVAPNLWWQATHDWPQVEMARVLSRRLAGETRPLLLPSQILYAGPLLVVLLWRGTRWLARDVVARPFRALLWAWPAGLVITFVTAGRPYYPLPLTLAVLVAGAVATDRSPTSNRLPTLLTVNVVTAVALGLPLLPVDWIGGTPLTAINETLGETVGWPRMVDQLAAVVHDLPATERPGVILLAGSYGEAGAIDRFGPARGLPPAYSPHNGYWYLRHPTDADDGATVVAVRLDPSGLRQWFTDCTEVDRVDNGRDIDSEVQGQPIVVCRGLRGTWSELWPKLRHLS